MQSMRPANGGPFVHMTPWIPCDGRSPCPAFRASRSRLLAEPSLGELQSCDIDVDPLAHHGGSRLSYLALLSLIATAQRQLVGRVADHELIGDPLRHLLAFGVRHGAQRRIAEEDAARLLARALDLGVRGRTRRCKFPSTAPATPPCRRRRYGWS